MPEATELRRKRGRFMAAITHLKNTLENYKGLAPELQIPEKLQVAADTLKTKYKAFEEVQDALEELEPTEEPKRYEIEGDYYDILGDITAIVSPLPRPRIENAEVTVDAAVPAAEPTPSAASLYALLRLPELGIMKFDGSHENWTPFWDSYDCNIHQQPDLSKVQKLQYFRSLLIGKAAKAIESLANTAENYDTAIQILKKKFDCERKILSRHWWILYNYPAISKETPEALGTLVDTVNQHLRSLKNLQQPIDSWDLPLIYLIQSKISAETFNHWERKIKDSKLPSYTDLLDYLENRAQCSTPINTSSSHERSSQPRCGRHAFISTETSCTMCQENHRINDCPKFKALSPTERYKAAKQASLCINCLGSNHSTKQCISRYDCQHCYQRHHSLLCWKEKTAVEKSSNKSPAKSADNAKIQPCTGSQA